MLSDSESCQKDIFLLHVGRHRSNVLADRTAVDQNFTFDIQTANVAT